MIPQYNSVALVCVCAQFFSRVLLFLAPWTVACLAPLSMGFPRQEYWSGLPFTTPGDLPDPGIEPSSLILLHWQVDSLSLASLGLTSLVAQKVIESAYSAGDPGSISGWEDPLEKEMAIQSNTLAWKIPWTEEPGRLQSMGSQRVRHD